MSNQQEPWKYFGRDAMTGRVIEIFRCPDNGKRLYQQRLEDVHLLLKDGTWRKNMKIALLDDLVEGRFDERGDEISERDAMNYYSSWQQSGQWPGRD
ncbi:hypothetical protein [Mycobacterium persicum]|uniref:Uncharacterized protein n=1 Tax=Mycobacterium persicum TaxID=1487726 RepID=A0AB38UVH3_9MYCO|nr:hypothetical protein [Mycobacterium persicum]VAZ77296.1 hypothetical protein LAUMK15_03755 [Mycobacterium persicum]VAZ84668.1 hypothetical protein LAUMK42_03491 [Mycobacterium persicum]VAZ96237.1 hypothetical protein LAUMK4_03441 [Mycobacterium persicum]